MVGTMSKTNNLEFRQAFESILGDQGMELVKKFFEDKQMALD